MSWFVYILKCADKSLYTGITTDCARRLQQHNSGVGAKYTRCRLPVVMVYTENAESRSDASKREYQIKKLSRQQKLALISRV